MDSSPRSEENQSKVGAGSVSSPSVKSEEPSSPQGLQGSPQGVQHGGGYDEEVDWGEDNDDLECLRAAVVAGAEVIRAPSIPAARNRLKNRLQNKGISALPPLPNITASVRRNITVGDLNRRITDLKMEGGTQTQTQTVDLQLRLGTNTIPRRDSNSTVSTYYGSMKSTDLGSSRRSSQASAASFPRSRPPVIGGSFYDPISPGSSRRSSQLSHGPPRSFNTSNLVLQTQHMSLNSNPVDNRRMSEPCRTARRATPPPRPSSVVLPPIGRQDHHPNQEVSFHQLKLFSC